MPASKKVVTHNHKLAVARDFIDSFDDNSYYMFAADHLGDSNNIKQPYDTVNQVVIDTYRNMLFGKRIHSTDVSLAIKKNMWQSGRVYTMYDDADTNMFSSPNLFYVITAEGSNYYVFKCLENNNGGASLVSPTYADFIGADSVFYPTDGYRWKYMFTMSSDAVNKFGTTNYFPVPDKTGTPAPGSIDVIKVVNPGRGYDNWYTGTFSTADIRLGGNTLVYAVGGNAASNTGFYDGCYIYISSGAGAGQYRMIQNYVVNSTSKYVVLDHEFDVTPLNNWTYDISPAVNIVGDGTQTVNAAARAIINTAGNTIYRVEMLSSGEDYAYATATVGASLIVGVSSNAVVRPIYSPPNGHGYSSAEELGASSVVINSQFIGKEDYTIFSDNDFARIGILKNPAFANVTLSLSNTSGAFIFNEPVYKINPLQVGGVGTINTSSSVVGVANADLSGLPRGTQVLLKSNTSLQIANVQSSNTSAIVIDGHGTFSSNAASIFLANTSASGNLVSSAAQSVTLTNFTGDVGFGDTVVGDVSGASGIITGITINGLQKDFNTFTQTWVYEGNQLNSNFTPDEVVFQGSTSTSNAKYVTSDTINGVYRIYTTNQIGVFNTSNTIVGLNSGAVASVTNKYVPDLVFGSGDILYIENSTPITRKVSQTETFKTVFEF